MTITLTLPILLTALGLGITAVVLHVAIGRWAGELQTTVRTLAEGQKALISSQQRGDEMVVSLRIDRHKHGTQIANLEGQVAAIEEDVGELMHDHRRGEAQP